MSAELFANIIANQCLILLLPILFFRRDGRYSLRWWLVALPFDISAFGVIAGKLGYMTAWQVKEIPPAVLTVLAVIATMLSTVIIGWTVGSHRVPLALWHQDNDAPVRIVTWGPYKYIRHPFYLSLLLAELAALLAFPSLATSLGFGYGVLAFSLTARREERRLLASEFGSEYRAYMERTGRLIPGIGRLSQVQSGTHATRLG